LGDPTGKFTEALDLSFDSAAIFGNNRSKRYALLVEDGKVKEAFVEPDNTGVNGKQSRNWIVGVIAERIIKTNII
jgi:2-Cys peroxiredoxin 5